MWIRCRSLVQVGMHDVVTGDNMRGMDEQRSGQFRDSDYLERSLTNRFQVWFGGVRSTKSD